MGQSPFAKTPTAVNPQANRRSTRVNFTVPIVISGRDAFNQSYREETETLIVSFHGAKVKTRNQILTGMHLSVENPQEGVAEEAICVGVSEAEAGQEHHAIAIQLLHARNLWRLEDPPDDWKSASEGPPISRAPGTQPAIPSTLAAPPATAPTPLSPTVATQGAGLDQRPTEIAESVLQTVRRQAAEIVGAALKDFEDRLKVLESGMQAKLSESSERAIKDSEGRISASIADAELALAKMRQGLMEQLAARTAEVITSSEENLRLKLAESLTTMLESSGSTTSKQTPLDESK